MINGVAVTWNGSKKKTIVDFACELEYTAATDATEEAKIPLHMEAP